MAVESYYFMFSLTAFYTLILHIISMIYIKRTSKTLAGEEMRPDSIGYKRFQRLLSPAGVIVTTIIAIATVANLTYNV